jgi:hypothetical protein
MISPADDVLRGAVQEFAEEVRVDRDLAPGAITRGRRIRSRRRVAGAAATVVAILAVGTPYLLVHNADRDGSASPTPSTVEPSGVASGYPRTAEPTTLPAAAGVSGAGDRPDLVGTDPSALHFDVRLSVVPGLIMSMWRTESAGESVEIAYDPGTDASRDISVHLSRKGILADVQKEQSPQWTEQTTVNGRPATLERYAAPDSTPPSPPTWYLRWQPVDGLWVHLVARDRTQTVFRAVAETLRLDQAQRCAQPMQVDRLPEGTRWTECHIGIAAHPNGAGKNPGLGVWWYSGLTLTKPDGTEITVSLEPRPPTRSLGGSKDKFRPNRTVAGQRAMWMVDTIGGTLRINDFHGLFDLYVSGRREADVIAVTAGILIIGDLANPDTWPPGGNILG